MNRYTIVADCDGYDICEVETESGDWVKYEDYLLEKERLDIVIGMLQEVIKDMSKII